MPNNGVKTINPATTDQALSGNYQAGSVVKAVGGNAEKGHVLAGAVFNSSRGIGISGTMPNNGTLNMTLPNNGWWFDIPAGYTSGGRVNADITNLIAANILEGVNVGGVVGTGRNGLKVWHSTHTIPGNFGGKWMVTQRGLGFTPMVVFAQYYKNVSFYVNKTWQYENNGYYASAGVYLKSQYNKPFYREPVGWTTNDGGPDPDFEFYGDGFRCLFADYTDDPLPSWNTHRYEIYAIGK